MKRTFKLQNSVLAVIVIQGLIFSLLTVLIIHFISVRYIELAVNQSAQVLEFYSEKIEQRLEEIENVTWNMIQDKELQQNLQIYYAYPGQYEAHQATTSIYSGLFARVYGQPSIAALEFHLHDGKTIRVSESHGQIPDQLRARLQEQTAAHGRHGVWVADPDDPEYIYLARKIHSTSEILGFREMGEVFIKVEIKDLLDYSYDNEYKTFLLLFLEQQAYTLEDRGIFPPDGMRIQEFSEPQGRLTLEGDTYFYTLKKLPSGQMTVISLLSESELLEPTNQVRRIYLVAMIVILFIVTLLLTRIVRAVLAPLQTTTRSMQQAQKGDYQTIPQQKGLLQIQETQRLTQSYNALVTEIDYLINEVYLRQLTISQMHYKILQQQINPHFLYNTLETIHWKAVAAGDETIPQMVFDLSYLLRSSLKKPDVITVGEDVELLLSYLGIQQVRFEERLSYTIDLPEEIQQCHLPKLTLQPLVENSIRHNLERYEEPCTIRVGAELGEEEYRILVSDSGTSADLQKIYKMLETTAYEESDRLGLRNINTRIQMMFGDEYGLDVLTDLTEGFTVSITLPLHTKEKDFNENPFNRR